MKNAPKYIFYDTSMKSIHFFRKKCREKKYFFEIQPVFGPKIGHLFMKNKETALRLKNDSQHWMILKDKKGQKLCYYFFMQGYLYLE